MNVQRRADAIRAQVLAIDPASRPRVELVVLARDRTGATSAHRWPVAIDVPTDALLPPSFAGSAAEAEHFRRSVTRALLQTTADLLARVVCELPGAAQGVEIVDVRLEVV